MRGNFRGLGSLVLLTAGLGGCAATQPVTTKTPVAQHQAVPPRPTPNRSAEILALPAAERGKRIVAMLVARDFEGVVRLFNAAMKAGLSAERLAQAWSAIEQASGPLARVVEVRLDGRAAIVRCQYAQEELDVQLVFEASGRVAGLWFKPATPPWQPPTYSHPLLFHEEDVLVGEGEWATPGTLTLPKGQGPFRALVLVHGSGPNDRDESSRHSPHRVFKDLAWGLASRGIAVLRYEKRTFVHGKKVAAVNETFTRKEEYVEDAVAAVELLSRDPRIDKRNIFVLGHSEGGTMAPQIGVASPKARGLVIFAGATRDFTTTILDQRHYIAGLDGEIDAEEQAAIDDMKQRVQPLRDPKLLEGTPAEKLPYGIPAAYWKDELAYDAVRVAKRYKRPILVLQGERDYQVTMADFANWKRGLAGRKQVTLRTYPKLDHHFIEGEGPSTPDSYRQPGHVAEYVINDIAHWIMQGRL